MPTLNRKYAVALVLLVLIGGFASCKTASGPFLTVTITGLPQETTKLVMTAVLGETSHSVESTPTLPPSPLTLDLPLGTRGALVVTAVASVRGTSCMLAMGTVTVDVAEDIAYEATLPLVASSLDGCANVPTVNTVTLTVNKVENGAAGSIVSNLAGINCAAGCNQQLAHYRPGTEVILTAQAGSGAQIKWSEPSCDTNLVCKITVSVDTTINLTITPCPHGSWCKEGAPGVDTDLFAVWGGAAGSVYAVGDAGKILMRTTAGQWMPMTSPVTVPLRTIGGETGSATPYAGGDNGTVLQLSGTWGQVKLDLVAGKTITGITAEKNSAKTSAYLCTADGGFYLKDGSSAWSLVTTATGKALHGVSAANGSGTDGHEATTVGDAGFVFRRTFYTYQINQERTADNTSAVTAAKLYGVWTGTALSVAVGEGGIIITRGTQDYGNTVNKPWSKVVNPGTSKLNSVWGGDDKNIWIVGDGGVVLKYDGTTLSAPLPNVPPIDIAGVWAADATNVYIVGRGGAIFHYQP